MELFSNIERAVRRWMTPSPPLGPNLNQVTKASKPVEDASAKISTAYGQAGTTFQIRYHGEDFLVTNAHVTTNGNGHTKGFISGDRHYFVIVRDNKIALAEHLLYNPQGAPCTNTNTFAAGESFRDISILKLLTPEEAKPVMNSIWSNIEGGVGSPHNRMANIIRSTSELRYLYNREGDGVINGNDMTNVLQNFQLGSVTLIRPKNPSREPHVTPDGYSIGFHRNRLQYAYGDIIRTETNETGDNGYSYRQHFTSDNHRSERGFSGGPAFDVDQTGKLVWRGINTGIVDSKDYQVITPIQYVLEGLDQLTGRDPLTGLPVSNNANLTIFTPCPTEDNGPDMWLTPTLTPTKSATERKTIPVR